MTNKINILYITEEAYETLKSNDKICNDKIQIHKENSSWLKEILQGEIFEEKKFLINNFSLKTSINGNYSEVDYENSIILYENLKDLPMYVLTDNRFWVWFNLTLGYEASVQALKVKSTSTFGNHWLGKVGKRRGLFFGPMSRSFFRVYLSVDDRLEDKYELTKFVIENPERIRNLTWRSSSNQKKIVLNTLKAEKKILNNYGELVPNNVYSEIAKKISLYGSIRLLDSLSEKQIYNFVYEELEKMVLQQTIN